MKSKVAFLGCVLFLCAVASLKWGSVSTPWAELIGAFTSRDESLHQIIFHLRIPRALSALFIGASLGVVGLVFQTLLRNPLAEPYTLGLSGGSSFGAVIALILSLSPGLIWVPVLSTLGCILAALLVLALARKSMEFESRSLILFGVMLSLFFGALVVTCLSLLSPDKLQGALLWLLGQLGTSRDQWIYPLSPLLLAGWIFIFTKHRALDALSLGETRSLSLGFSPRRERALLILASTLLTALSVSISGLVGFIGLVSPHLARNFLKTSKHSFLIVSSLFIGASLLLFSDTLGRLFQENLEIPAGSVAALMGAPLLLVLLVRHDHAAID